MPTVELDHRLVAALVGIVNDRDGLLPDGEAGAVDPGDQDEPACDALPLNGHLRLAVAEPGVPGWEFALVARKRSRAQPPIALRGRVGELGLPEWVLELIVFAVIAAVTAAIFIWVI